MFIRTIIAFAGRGRVDCLFAKIDHTPAVARPVMKASALGQMPKGSGGFLLLVLLCAMMCQQEFTRQQMSSRILALSQNLKQERRVRMHSDLLIERAANHSGIKISDNMLFDTQSEYDANLELPTKIRQDVDVLLQRREKQDPASSKGTTDAAVAVAAPPAADSSEKFAPAPFPGRPL